MAREIIDALHTLERERGIPHQVLLRGIEDAMAIAYRKTDSPAPFVQVRFDEESGGFRVYQQHIPDHLAQAIVVYPDEEDHGIDPHTGERREGRPPHLDLEALLLYRNDIEENDVTPEHFGRVAALTARQVITQKLRDFDQDQVYAEYAGREGELVIGTVQQGDRRHTLVKLQEGVEALLPHSEQVKDERYRPQSRLRCIIKEVSRSEKGCSIVLSRRSPELIRQLFYQEVPEASNGLIGLERVVRDPGVRSKIGVIALQDNIDPVGACVGPRGSRVRNVVTELGGEKVDIIPLDADPARFLAKSLSPARVREVEIDDAEQKATVIVPDDQVAMAIGAGGQNVRLTAKLTGWKIDILSESQFAQLRQFESEEDEGGVDGRCTAVLGNGRRCPNAALVASTYCGLPRHAVLVHFDTHSVKILHGIENEEVQDLLEGRREEEVVARANELNFEVYAEDQKAHQTASEERQRQEELSASIAEG